MVISNASTSPLTTPRWPQPASPAHEAEAARSCLIRLLVVDDDLGSIEYLGQLLKGFAQISFATSGEDALRLAERRRPDLVLLDMELPGLNGFEVCRRLRATPGLHDLPVIFASQHTDAATQASALHHGANDFLCKPFDDAQVLARLRHQLRAAAHVDERADDTGAAPGSRTRILVIDDDAGSQQLVRRLLADVGECHFAGSGAQALGLLDRLRPDLILLDIDLPDSDGMQLCKTLRADPALGQVPIMFLTQSSTIGHEARALARGGDDFVRKPFSAPVLRARVRRLMDRKHSPERHVGPAGEQQRRLSGSRVAAIVEACKDAILIADADDRIVMANAAACALIGLEDGPLRRLRLAELLSADDRGRHTAHHVSGLGIPVEVSTSTEGDGADALTVHVLRDTRERDRLQSLLRRQDEAAAARRATASMLSYIAHELGNPVNVIKGFAQLMQADAGAPLPPAQAEKLSHILDAVGRLGSLLADVTDVARMESGQFLVQPGEVELGALVQQACGPALAQAAAAGLRLSLPAPGAPVLVSADARRLRQCLDNLLSNAMKYGRDGGRIEVEIARRGGDIALAVQDHGAGLGATQMAHLFEPYNRLGQDGGAIPGTGLGLTLTRELVQAMGGRLLVHSDGPGRGCRFELLLRPAPD